LLQQLGDAEGAIGEYRAAIAMRPDFPSAHYNLGVALAAQGSVAEARQHLQKAAQSSDPKLRQAAFEALKRASL
jgi:Flp pilus assembly protein TadD